MTRMIDQRLSSLEGARVIESDTSAGGTTLFFESGEVLAIYAPVSYKTLQGCIASGVDEVSGRFRRLNRVLVSGEKLILQFEEGGRIEVDVLAGRDIAPEILQLVDSGGVPTVWRS
jgi:hypothetical protein